MIPDDIKQMNDDELEIERLFLWKILDNTTLKNWEALDERMHYIAYELTIRETPVAMYHYLSDDKKHKSEWHRISWKERKFISLSESIYSYDRPKTHIIRIEEFINRCNHGFYDDINFSFRYLLKIHDYYITVYMKHGFPCVDAAKKDCLRKDFKFIQVEER